ncbi:1-acyl-sn-glycerol-3-phosphate acyltransferase [Deinococcus sp.]|uniref:1-acyl-sn-glycerol-3-phosphate acyltransferase n=1 Tax=Deinococcus sp. TaxID=47478 RepID=UPI002869C351|nr:1-acyl-sn-glycerol-3-phosphate acyltransferase [Deinococcus sp.]
MSPLWPGRQHTLTSRLALLTMRALGWTPVLAPPPGPKFVAAVAPHTSNMDFWPGILLALAMRLPMHFLAKRELFTPPLGILMRALGGMSVDRRKAGGNFVDAVVAIINRETELVLAVAPEGTRSRGDYWKTGFYYMALEAGVPIGVTAFDWGRRQFGMIGYVHPTGNIDADFAEIRALLQDVRGRRAGNETPAFPRPADAGGPSRS